MPKRTRTPLVAAALLALGVVAVRVLAFQVAEIHRVDALTLHGFVSLDRPAVHWLAWAVANAASPLPYGLFGAALIAGALARGHPRLAAAVALIMAGAAFTTDYVLKPALAADRYAGVLGTRQIAPASFPSGHATAAMALALCAILVAPPRRRPIVCLIGAVYAVVVSYAFLSLSWHYPSDVLGGYLVSAAWSAAALAALRWADARWPAGVGRETAARVIGRVSLKRLAAVAAALAAVTLAFVLVATPERALDFLRFHTTFAVGAAGIAAAALAVVTGIARILRA
jgi:membrane-associated phospholipid phosphatase